MSVAIGGLGLPGDLERIGHICDGPQACCVGDFYERLAAGRDHRADCRLDRHHDAGARRPEPDEVAFDADRGDFNGALAQFAIGLLQTTTPVDNPVEWKQLYASPPLADVLRAWFAPVASAFAFEGNGSRFMQDRTLQPGDEKYAISFAVPMNTPGLRVILEAGGLIPHLMQQAQAAKDNAKAGQRG